MAKEEDIEMEGKVEKLLPNMYFIVVFPNGTRITAHLCGKMKKGNIRVYVGDRVTVKMTPYDLTLGRISYRLK